MKIATELSECIVDDSDCILKDQEVRGFLTERKMVRVFDYAEGSKVFEAKRRVAGFYLVCHGVVREFSSTVAGDEVTLSLFKRGDVLLGDDFFLDEEYRNTSAATVSESRVLMIEQEAFPQLMRLAGEKLGKKIARNMKRLRRRLELYSCSVLQNTAFWLLRLISNGENSSFAISNKELSDIVGCSPVTLSRKLGKLQSKGLIEKKGRNIRVKDGERLEEVIDCPNIL